MPKSLFDHLKAVYENQSVTYFDTLEDPDKKTYQTFMINRLVSMSPAFVPYANVAQMYGTMEPRISYLFFSQLLPKGKRYDKYIKGEKVDKYPDWMVDVVTKHFLVSSTEAITYLDIYHNTVDGKAELRHLCEGFATDPKLIKKAGL
jgi:hypothetical protein